MTSVEEKTSGEILLQGAAGKEELAGHLYFAAAAGTFQGIVSGGTLRNAHCRLCRHR